MWKQHNHKSLKVWQLHLLKEQKAYIAYLLTIKKAINPYTQKRSLQKKLVKIGKNSTVKSKIGKAKETTKSSIAKYIAKDQHKTQKFQKIH